MVPVLRYRFEHPASFLPSFLPSFRILGRERRITSCEGEWYSSIHPRLLRAVTEGAVGSVDNGGARQVP